MPGCAQQVLMQWPVDADYQSATKLTEEVLILSRDIYQEVYQAV